MRKIIDFGVNNFQNKDTAENIKGLRNIMTKQSPISRKILLEFGHTCMNHFVVIDCRGIESPPMGSMIRLAKTFCTTTMADDLLILQDSEIADARLRVMGVDGREADFCGNGMIYVSAKIGEELKKDKVKIESASGIKTAIKLGKEWKIEIGPAIMLDEELARVPVSALQGKAALGLVRAGEPHLVMDNPNIHNGFHMHIKDFEDYCRPLLNITEIEGGVSITMVFENRNKKILIRTFERGARRHTFSCGTGSVSAVAVLFDIPLHGNIFDVCSAGGRHKVIYEEDRWYLVAIPQRIATGYLENSVMYFPLAGLKSYVV